MHYPVYEGKQFPVLRDDCEVLRTKNCQILKITSSSLDPLSRDRSMVSWRVKCVVLGEIHCYTNLILDNFNVHVSYLIFDLELGK